MEMIGILLKGYLAFILMGGVGFYIAHRVRPYGRRRIPDDFLPPADWIGSFTKGQFVGYLIRVFLFPISVLAAAFAYCEFRISEEISIFIGVVLLNFLIFWSNHIEEKLDGLP